MYVRDVASDYVPLCCKSDKNRALNNSVHHVVILSISAGRNRSVEAVARMIKARTPTQ